MQITTMHTLQKPTLHTVFARRHAVVRSRNPSLLCRAEEAGVQDLLARDRKGKDKMPGLEAFIDESEQPQPTAASKAAQAADAQNSSRGKKGKGKRKGFRTQSQAVTAAQQVAMRNAKAGATTDGPRTSRQSIDAGLEAYADKRYQDAIELFELALELPGSGSMRLEGTVKEYSCASEGEENAALYNMACAYVALGQTQPAVTCLEGLLENGFDDFKTIRSDPDLAPLRGLEMEKLLIKYDNPIAKVVGQKKDKEASKMPQWMRPW